MNRQGNAPQQREKTSVKAKWLIMVYLNVDGWKSNFAIESLKQLKSGASADVVVAAQLGVETASGNKYFRYIFDGQTEPQTSINPPIAWDVPADTNMADANTLAAFIEWARNDPKTCQADQYCLVLWMDGILPLYEPVARRKMDETRAPAKRTGESANGRKRVRYIEPYKLRQALERGLHDAKESKPGKKFQIVAMDACSMSMVEYAYELKDLAEYLVASEEAVPYWSFPYASILEHFRRSKAKEDAGAICNAITKDYTRAYQDCLCSSETGINPVMLSALRLGDQGIGALKEPLNNLAQQMQSSTSNGKSPLCKAILEARRKSQDFAFGTFVDLANFCDNLGKEEKMPSELKDACANVCKVREKFVDANEVDTRANVKACTGLTIYFPFFKENEQLDKIIDVVLDKGAGSSSGEAIGKSAAGVSIATRGSHYALRQEVIKDIETYYQNENFNFGQATEWYKFIRCVWSSILAQNEPWLLDLRYSAEQCASNLVNDSKRTT